MLGRSSDAISPTAHYTGEVWRRHGLGHPALGTWQGRALHAATVPLLTLSRVLGGPTLDGFLLARHQLIDGILEEAIASGRVGQVVEIAAGMSPRGLLLGGRHPELTYVEADLPAMAARKREALERAGAHHRVVELDALAAEGPLSLAALASTLDPARGTAVVTEGLLNYFPRQDTDRVWGHIAAALSRFEAGLYLSDLHLASDQGGGLGERAFMAGLGLFVRGRVHLPYRDEDDARGALAAAGFERCTLHPGSEGGSGPGAELVHVIEAGVGG